MHKTVRSGALAILAPRISNKTAFYEQHENLIQCGFWELERECAERAIP